MKRNKCMPTKRVVITIIMSACILFYWTHLTEREAHYTPEYSMEDISPCLEKESLTEEDYRFLYRQTGLGRIAIDILREEDRCEEILAVQERFFEEVEVCCKGDLLIFNEEIADLHNKVTGKDLIMPVLQDGDILITFNSHFLGWRNGHAAIVIDARRGLTLEALMMGKNSTVMSVRNWEDCPSYAVLRPLEMSEEQCAAVADYAENTLRGVPYRLTAGVEEAVGPLPVWGAPEMEAGNALKGDLSAPPAGTQCAHLVWYAYKQFGYNLDSDSGWIVTPKDLYDSPLLEVVQVYGMEPK